LGKGLGYSIEVAPGVPENIVTDPQRLRQILKNLLANAFKFTDAGEVHIDVSLAENGWSPYTESLVSAPSVVALAIRDTGIGIDEELQRRVFEAFAQADGTTARLYGGTGLGLSVARELAGLLGGEITLTSAAGGGSTFTVYLPLSRPIPAAVTADEASVTPVLEASELVVAENGRVATANGRSADQGRPATAREPGVAHEADRSRGRGALDDHRLTGTTVLVVDDDFRNVFALTALLERVDGTVVTAESGRDAITALEQNPDIDIVLMDIMMPVMDGYAAMRAIRVHEQIQAIPIIAVTCKVVTGERERCLDAGANDYVPKPVNTAELLTAIWPWLPQPQDGDCWSTAQLTSRA
jgi:CheY-like chemotaxis protein